MSATQTIPDPANSDLIPEEQAEDMPLPSDPQTIFLGGLFFFAVLVVLYVGRAILLPVVIAIVLKLLLQPVVRGLERLHVPKGLGALVSVLLLLGIFASLGAILSGPAAEMVRNMPAMLSDLHARVVDLQPFLDRARPVLDVLGMSTDPGDMVKVSPGSLVGGIAGGASSFASHLLETLLILYYLLVFSETFMLRLVEVIPRLRDKKQAVAISDAVERDISAYLVTITIINAVVGILAGLVMWGFGIPGALLWGVLAFCFNYVPILGPFAGVALFAVVGLATLGLSWIAIVPAAAYLAIHFAEGEIITPLLLAKRFTLNPVAVIIALIFWYWMWGVQGAILSVPLLAVVKIMSDRLRPFRAVGHLLEG